MAIEKICGLEQEYAIHVRNARNYNPVEASYLVVNSYHRITKSLWDYNREAPFHDARGLQDSRETDIRLSSSENYNINNLLPNGARLYVDHAHPEYSTAECLSLLDLIAFDRAGDRILDMARIAATESLIDGDEVQLYKNNSDQKGSSYGSHENYLVTADLYHRLFPQGVRSLEGFGILIPFFVTRQVFTGAGKTGSENARKPVDFQLTQRADFFETEIGTNTTVSRPILNTRDEPHADPEKYRRLHVIVGDANMCEVSTLLKVGTTKLMLSMLEDNFLHKSFALKFPVKEMVSVSHDLQLKHLLQLESGGSATALDIQKAFLDLATDYCKRDENNTDENNLVLEQWRRALNALGDKPMQLDGVLDWVTKYSLMQRQINKRDLSWKHPRIRKIDISYHDINPEKGLYFVMEKANLIERVLPDDEKIKHFLTEPPEDTRAYFRAHCLRKFGDEIIQTNWDVIYFRSETGKTMAVPLMHPMRGGKVAVEELLLKSETPNDLIRLLSKG